MAIDNEWGDSIALWSPINGGHSVKLRRNRIERHLASRLSNDTQAAGHGGMATFHNKNRVKITYFYNATLLLVSP